MLVFLGQKKNRLKQLVFKYFFLNIHGLRQSNVFKNAKKKAVGGGERGLG